MGSERRRVRKEFIIFAELQNVRKMSEKLVKHPDAKALIFDIDGTLADTMPIHFIAWRNAVKPYGIDFTRELFDEMAGLPVKESVVELNERFGTKMDPVLVGESKEKEVFKHLHLMKPIQSVCDLVYQYAGKLPMALGTGGQRENAWKVIEAIGLRKYFEVLVAAEDVENHKPAPDTFLKCAILLGVDPNDCQVFEDGKRGIQAAIDAGMIVTDVTKYYEVTIGKEII